METTARTNIAKSALKISLSCRKSNLARERLSSPSDTVGYARKLYRSDINIYETAWGLFLNRANEVIGFMKVSQGGTSSSSIDNKIICKAAIDLLASGVILIHNHPSGQSNPSTCDIKATALLRDALKTFDISLLDHVILTDSAYYSFTEEQGQ